ncbi:SDH family Clp fold serine proteinase [Bdellovibrio sp. HCB209]|uniref:SDH family Clp fold serine proteinase n=1 Tax=Bdellovibrio sp. HCB209 TaxID=3394354 RepID=UPI0039B43734
MTSKIDQLISEIQSERKNPVLVLKEDEIGLSTVYAMHDLLAQKSFDTLDVLLHTPGGDPDAAYKMARILKDHCKRANILVPAMAKSAGTLFSLCGDEVILSELGELGPLDTQIEEHAEGGNRRFNSALNGFKALEQIKIHTLETMDLAAKMILLRSGMRISECLSLAIQFSGQTSGTLYSKLDAQKIGEYARALDIGEKYGVQILHRMCKWPIETAKKTVTQLVRGYPSHGYVLDYDELKSLGLNVSLISHTLSETFVEIGKTFHMASGKIIKLADYSQSQNETVTPEEATVEA